MIYLDKVYGNIEITEKVILDLMNSKTMERLKGVDQAGYFEPYFPGTKRTRFEHSVGVCLLLKKYGATVEEQISGFIHDVSHSVFSHVIDYVLDSGSTKMQDHQDNIFEDYVRKTEIPEILKQNNFNLERILDDKNFLLKEKDIPDLCADRIDYVLRDAIAVGKIENANYFLENLIVENNTWIFKNFDSAEKFAKLFLKMNNENYADLISAVVFHTVGDYLKYSIIKGYITSDDLYTTDKLVLEKIAIHHRTDDELQLLFDRMNNKIRYKNDANDYQVKVFCKSRIVDPFFKTTENKIKRISEAEPKWVSIIEDEMKPKEYFLKFDR